MQLAVRTAGGGPEAEVAWVCDTVRRGCEGATAGEGATGERAFPVFSRDVGGHVAIDGNAAAASSVGADQQRYHEALAALLRRLFLERSGPVPANPNPNPNPKPNTNPNPNPNPKPNTNPNPDLT